MLTILQLHNSYRERGGEDAVSEMEADAMDALGHRVIRYKVQNPDEPSAATLAMLASVWNPLQARRVRDEVLSHAPDVVHVHNTWFQMSPAVVRAASRSGIPVALTLHNYRLMCVNAHLFRDGSPCETCVGRSPLPGVIHKCYHDSLGASATLATSIAANRLLGTWDGVTRFVALTEFARTLFIRGGLPADLISVKSNFVPDPGVRARQPSESTEILFVGRLIPEKGVVTLLDAWKPRRGSRLRLVVIGEGPLADTARSTPGVTYLGRMPPAAIRKRMLHARAVMFPSISYEAQGLVLLEAMAAGLPVITSDLGGLPETLGWPAPAWSAPPGDVESWSERLDVLEDDSMVDDEGERNRRVYENRYTPAIGAAKLVELYRAVVEEGNPKSRVL